MFQDKLLDEEINAPDQLGYLIQRVNGQFLFTCVSEFPDSNQTNKCWANGTSFYFSNESSIDYDWTLSPELDNNVEKPDRRELSLIQQQAMKHLIYPLYWDDNIDQHKPELAIDGV